MSILDWIIISGLSLAVLLLFLGTVYIVLTIKVSQLLKKLPKKRPKDAKKRKKITKKKNVFTLKRRKNIKRAIFFLVMALFSTVGAFYARYYQMTTLTTSDGNAIIQSYFLTDEIEKGFVSLQEDASPEKIKNTLQERSSLLTSYGTTDPSAALTMEGKRLLKRYFTRIREYGVNVYSLNVAQLEDAETVTKYLKDLEEIKEMQKKIFEQFGINQSALKKKN